MSVSEITATSRPVRHLREKHRAEFSGADETDTNGFAGGGASSELGLEVHGSLSVTVIASA
jgi:hypothetical protein